MFNSNYKRLPQNPNVKLHWGKTYNDHDLLPGVGAFIKPNLAKIERVLSRALDQSSKLYAVRLDLRFPQNYELSGLGNFSNKPLQRFITGLRRRLDNHFDEGTRTEIRRHPHNFAYLWSREYDKGHTRPHFHVLLIFNGQAFRTIGNINSGGLSLYRMVEESWLSALRCQGMGLDRLVHLCDSGQYWLSRENEEGFNALFQRASYMAKVRDKDFNDGFHRFGGGDRKARGR